MERTRGFEYVLNSLVGIFFPRRETRTMTVKGVSAGVLIETLAGRFYVVQHPVPCTDVIFEELPEITFTTFRNDLVPGTKVEVTLLLDKNGEIVDRQL